MDRATTAAASSQHAQQDGPRPVPVFHPAFGAARMTVEPRPADDELATAQTIARMREYAREDSQAAEIRAAALGLTVRTQADTAARIFDWIRRRVRFVPDATLAGPVSSSAAEDEVLIRPRDLMRMQPPTGDCDDFSMLCAALLRAAGIPSSFRTVAADPADPSRYSHVYVIAHTDAGELALDTSHGPYPGWEAQRAGKARDWPVDPMTTHLQGLRAIDWNAIIQSGVKAGTQIATSRYGTPQVATGTYIQSGPQGSTVFRQQPGAAPFEFPTTQISGASGTLILLAGIAVVLLLVMRKGH